MLLTILIFGLGAMRAPIPPCATPVAPDEAAARRIAAGLIAARSMAPADRYVLRLVADPDDPTHWLAYQSLRGASAGTRGGGGLGMRIDRCTGAVTDVAYQR